MKKHNDKRSASSNVQLTADKRLKVVSDLAVIGGVSRHGLATALKLLNEQGLLTDALASSSSALSYTRQVRNATEDEALHAHTPYGPIMRSMRLPLTKEHYMNYAHPFAMLHYISSINKGFFDPLKTTAEQHAHRLRIVMYVDGVNPGNPLHPDPNVMLEAVYWTIIDLPVWFTRRKDSWFCFTLARSKVAHDLQGEMSEFMKLCLLVFYPEVGESFSKGVFLQNGTSTITVAFSFEGLLITKTTTTTTRIIF